MTEAAVGQTFILGCISCKQREEIEATTTVDWHFRPLGEEEYGHVSMNRLLSEPMSTSRCICSVQF